jgi:hypothetical protein
MVSQTEQLGVGGEVRRWRASSALEEKLGVEKFGVARSCRKGSAWCHRRSSSALEEKFGVGGEARRGEVRRGKIVS